MNAFSNRLIKPISGKSISVLIVGLLSLNSAFATTLEEAISDLQKEWAIAYYETSDADLGGTFEALTLKAQKTVIAFPEDAEPLVWNAIIVSSDAGKNGGLSALGKVKEARTLLLKAEKIDPNVLHGSIYTSLGSLYYQVPGWPLAYGDDDQAEVYLKKALSMNPDGIDPNYFYGDFLLENGRYKEAKVYMEKALDAPERPSRPVADAGRRAEVLEKLKVIAHH